MANKITDSSIYKWLSSQTSINSVIHTALVLGIFGFIPGAWMIGLPILVTYGLIKQRTLGASLNVFGKGVGDFAKSLAKEIEDRIVEALSHKPMSILKALGVLALLLTMGINSWSLVAFYGIYRFSNEQWMQTFQGWLDTIYKVTIGFLSKISDNATSKNKLIIGAFLAALFAAELLTGGLGTILFLGAAVLQAAIVGTGFSALFKDINYALKNPIKVFMDHSGKILGALWGRWLAYQIFPGRIVGNLGHAIGHVENQGIFSGIFSSFLSPSGWFTSQSGGILGVISSKLRTLFNSVFTSVFLTTEMHTHGDFYGVIGPSSVQLFALMALGCVVGYGVEKFVSNLCHSVADDVSTVAQNATRNAKSINQTANDLGFVSKWHVGFVASVTPLILMSQGGAQLIALAGGSVLGAAALTAAGLALSLSGVVAATAACKYGYNKLMANDAPSLAAKRTPVAKTTKQKAQSKDKPSLAKPAAKVITHSFQKHQQKEKSKAGRQASSKSKVAQPAAAPQKVARTKEKRALAK